MRGTNESFRHGSSDIQSLPVVPLLVTFLVRNEFSTHALLMVVVNGHIGLFVAGTLFPDNQRFGKSSYVLGDRFGHRIGRPEPSLGINP